MCVYILNYIFVSYPTGQVLYEAVSRGTGVIS